VISFKKKRTPSKTEIIGESTKNPVTRFERSHHGKAGAAGGGTGGTSIDWYL